MLQESSVAWGDPESRTSGLQGLWSSILPSSFASTLGPAEPRYYLFVVDGKSDLDL